MLTMTGSCLILTPSIGCNKLTQTEGTVIETVIVATHDTTSPSMPLLTTWCGICRGEAGHKALAKRPGHNSNKRQSLMPEQLAFALRARAMLPLPDASDETFGVDPPPPVRHSAIDLCRSTQNTSFLASVSVISWAALLPGALAKAQQRTR